MRLFGSASFTLFHIFRMAVVMSLTGLALAVATPLTPAQSVLLMGVLSIIYCTMGGIEAVIWTDTIQTFVLLGGAVLALAVLINGVDGGMERILGNSDGRRQVQDGQLSLGRDQHSDCVVGDCRRRDRTEHLVLHGGSSRGAALHDHSGPGRQAARSIWTNAVLTIPATLLFFGIGTALFRVLSFAPGTSIRRLRPIRFSRCSSLGRCRSAWPG